MSKSQTGSFVQLKATQQRISVGTIVATTLRPKMQLWQSVRCSLPSQSMPSYLYTVAQGVEVATVKGSATA